MPDSHPRRGLPLVFLALLSLTTFAFAQSVYQAIAGNAEFVVLNRITRADLLLIILVFNVAPALVLAVLWFMVQRWKPAAADAVLSASFLLLLTPFLFELHKTYLSLLLRFPHNTVLVVLPLAVAGGVVFLYRREFRRFLLVLSPGILLFPGLFLARTWHQASPAMSAPAVVMASVPADNTGQPYPPIFIVVLDEFTRPAMLDSHGNIDASRYPDLAEFAQHSTWFTNATANAEYTTRSIPVIVTGNFPHGNDASDAAYPNNLFRLFAPDYDVTVHEVVTRFCVSAEYHCPDAARVQQRNHLLRAILKLYIWRVAPKSVVIKIQGDDLRDEQQRFRQFLQEITPPSSKPVLEFMHLDLPHAPYMLTPGGAVRDMEPNSFEARFAGDDTLLRRLRNDYEMQIEFVDREFGEFIDRLKQTGLYNRALIVVTSDHGVSWKTDAPGRSLSDANADMIFPVPLLIKLPGQTEPRVSSQDAQSIDLVPTIAAVVGVNLPWQAAGHNLFGPPAPAREKIMFDSSGRKFAYPADFAETVPKP